MSGAAGSHLATTKRESRLPINGAKAEEVKLTTPPPRPPPPGADNVLAPGSSPT